MRSHADSSERLASWKEIAGYLGRTIRTVQRWERASGLPVHRHLHVKSASVYATKGELDIWWASRQTPAAALDADGPPDGEVASRQPYDLYVMARRAWTLRSPDSLRQSIELAKCAVARDPTFALGYAAIGLAEVSLASLPCEQPRAGMERAREAALVALSLAPANPDAHATLGAVSILFDWDAGAARASFDRAIGLDPDCSTAWLWYSIVHMTSGDFEEGIRSAARAQSLEPDVAVNKVVSAWLLYLAGHPRQALSALQAALRQNPYIPRAYFYAAWCYDQLGQFDQAVQTMQTCVALADNTTCQAALVYAYARAGRTAEARQHFETLLSSSRHTSPYWLAVAHLGIGDSAAALASLEQSVEQREWYVVAARYERVFDPIRQHPAFIALMARAKVADRRDSANPEASAQVS